jgi:acetylornithine/succinyldiaminopimelate/putrescine aminotransferase/predicted amino acid dehydrogenase/acyl-coenzyme A synthetase/AMP-(fatty) acid ligase
MNAPFDILIKNQIEIAGKKVKTIGQILFEPLEGRHEESNIILSHIENSYTEISLSRLRLVVFDLIHSFKEKNIGKGQTVILVTFHGCNEMFTALYFTALASMGCRVFMPMYYEKSEFLSWIDFSGATHIVIPEGEVMSLDGHEKEKLAIREIKAIAFDHGVKIWDNLVDFGLVDSLRRTQNIPIHTNPLIFEELLTVQPDQDLLIVTTSGTSGRSSLLVYTHEAYFLNCLAWQQAGLYDASLLGGTGFTPLFTHTMGIRAFVNALWTGVPVCLIITEWFMEKPEVVRYLLLKMKPAHITGGPAVYNAFIELFRVYPELKSGLSNHLKTLVSSGALYNPVTAREILDATGISLQNAFGTSETQQVLSTLLGSRQDNVQGLIPLGKPLPGVSIGLIKTDTGTNQFRLFIKSVFGHKYCLSDPTLSNSDFCNTGDIVSVDEDGNLYYSGRANLDFFKDNFGVKIPIQSLRNYYGELFSELIHAEFYPIINFPGISALLFINDSTTLPGQVTDSRILKRYAGIVEGINNRLMFNLDTFEFQHRHVCRIAILNGQLPLTGKGSVSVREITSTHHSLIGRLTDTRKDSTGIEITERLYQVTDKYTRFISPRIGTVMSALKINVSYHRGLKDSLFTYFHGIETEVLDLVGGYGTNLVGHNHPVISKALTDFVSSGKPAICNQASIQQTTGLLAEKLNLMIGASTGRSYQVILANSGSEAVEMALHHALFEWKKRWEKYRDQQLQVYGSEVDIQVAEIWKTNMNLLNNAVVQVIALSHAYHGHSTGSRSMLGNKQKRNAFRQLSRIQPLFIDDSKENLNVQLEAFLEESTITIHRIIRDKGYIESVPFRVSTIIAAISEPVTGEGGVRVANRSFLERLATCEFPLISDEIQCGLGRTGSLPDFGAASYILFGKALGGGLEKVAAVLIDSTRYCYDFGENYVSTFGNGELAAQVALTTLQVIEDDKLSQRCSEVGNYLQEKLIAIQSQFPSIIQDIQGKGLLQAIYFDPDCAQSSILLRVVFQTEQAGYLFAGWFLNRHHIRILPSLSATNVLRIEPSAYFSLSEVNRFCLALSELCQIIQEVRVYDLFSFLMDDDPFPEKSEGSTVLNHYNPILESPADGAVQVAFIAHFAFPANEMRMLEPDLDRASDTGLRIFFKRMQILLELKPVKLIATHLFNRKVHFTLYVMPLDSAELEYLHKSGKRRYVVSKIQDIVDTAAAGGASIISLGGYNSILTNNGLSLTEPPGTRIITGNTLTAASGLMHLGNVIRQSTEFNKPNTIAIIGSSGNIGRIITQMLYEQDDICKTLLLVSRTDKRQMELVKGLLAEPNQKIEILSTQNLAETKKADVIVICTNTNDPIVFPHHIASDKPVIISDLSVPSAVSEEVKLLPNVTVLPFVSYIRLPEDPHVVISPISPPGTVFCCAGEAVLLGMEPFTEPLKGKITPQAVKKMTGLADQYGFFHSIESMKSYKTSKA